MKYMVIDIGSNTVKYDVFSVKEEGYFLVAHSTYPARLIGKIENGELNNEGEKLLLSLIKKFKSEGKSMGCADILPFATAGLRKLHDPAPLLEKIKKECGLDVRILTGKEEGECSFKGMLLTLSEIPTKGMMLDMGGGSTEINFFEGEISVYLHSCPFGAGVLKKTFNVQDQLDDAQKEGICALVDDLLPEDLPSPKIYGKTAVLVGGTAKTAAKLARKLCGAKMSGERLNFSDFEKIAAVMYAPTLEQYEAAKQIAPDRYKLMASGICGFSRIFEKFETEELYIAPGGVREGYLATVLGSDRRFYL